MPATYFPPHNRATVLGISTGIGRLGAVAGPLVGGYLVGSGLGLGWNFGAFAIIAILGALTCVVVPASATTTADPATPPPSPHAAVPDTGAR